MKMELSVNDLRRKRLEFFSKLTSPTTKYGPEEAFLASAYDKQTTLTVLTTNKKLDEFKKIVESVNKPQSINEIDRFFSSDSSRRSSGSLGTNGTDHLSNRSVDLNNNELSNISCKVQYMSAYNVYEPLQPQPPIESTNYRKMSMSPRIRLRQYRNSDDSISPSSSSPSSAAYPQPIPPTVQKGTFEIHPPSTPKSDAQSFKRNFSRKLSLQPQTSIEIKPIEVTKSEPELINQAKSDETEKEQQSDSEDTLDNASEIDAQSQLQQQKPNVSEIKLDLACLTDDDENEKNNDEVQIKVELKETSSTTERSVSSPECDYYYPSDTYRQVKPSFIPNLMLNDDEDRSISVAASLAKSMCNEIDYKQEMETLVKENLPNKKINEVKKLTRPKEKRPSITSARRNSNSVNNVSNKMNTTMNQIDESPFFLHCDSNEPPLARPKTAVEPILIPILDKNFEKYEPKKLYWESADVNSKSNLKINLFAANRNRTLDTKITKRPNTASQIISKSRSKSPQKTQKVENISMDVTGSKLFFNFSKLHQIDDLKIDISPDDEETLLSEKTTKRHSLTQTFESNWISLPYEIWLNIIKMLNLNDRISFSRACKLFYQIFNDNTLWKSIKIKNCQNIDDTTLSWIASKQPIELNLIQCNGNVSLHQISDMFKALGEHLKVLNLSSCFNGQLSSENMALQASVRCPNIRSLDLSWTLLTNDSLKLIADSYESIESINLSGCNMVKDDGFNYFLVKHSDKLEELEMAGCFHLPASCILNIGVYCSNLKKLNISNCHRITNQTLMESCINWSKLKFLDIRGLKDIKNNCISQIVRKCANLEGIALANCLHLSDLTMSEIATYKSNIKYLDCKGCKKITDNGIRSLVKTCFQIEYLDLTSTSVTNEGVEVISNSAIIQSLEELNLNFLSVNEQSVIKLVSNSKKLEKLHLHCCYNIKKFDDIRNAANKTIKNLVIDY